MTKVLSTPTTSTQKNRALGSQILSLQRLRGVDKDVFVVSVEILLNEEKRSRLIFCIPIIALSRTLPSLALIAAPS